MVKHRCPHCGNDGISGLRKCCLGPMIPASCSSCGKAVGVPYWSIVAVLPLVASILVLLVIPDNALAAYWLGAIGATVMWVLWGSVVPLVKR